MRRRAELSGQIAKNADFEAAEQTLKHLQTTPIEAAKVAPRWHPEFALLYDQQKQEGNHNRATLAIARSLFRIY